MNTATKRERGSPASAGIRLPRRSAAPAPRRITCCEDDRLPVLLGGKVFHVKQGAIG